LRYVALLSLVALVAAAPAAATAVAPCKLVTKAEAATTLGASVLSLKQKAEAIGLFQSCMYKAGRTSFLQIETRTISKPDFVRSAKSNMRPVTAVSLGGGALAYSAAYVVLLVWHNGSEATFLLNAPGKSIADTEKLAKKILSRL
jgi:flagellar motor component MotA